MDLGTMSIIPQGINVADIEDVLNYLYEIDNDNGTGNDGTTCRTVKRYVLATCLQIPTLITSTIAQLKDMDVHAAPHYLNDVMTNFELPFVNQLQCIIDQAVLVMARDLTLMKVDTLLNLNQNHLQLILTKAREQSSVTELKMCNIVTQVSLIVSNTAAICYRTY